MDARRANVRRFLHARYRGTIDVTDELVDLVIAGLDGHLDGAPRCAHEGLCDRRDPACVAWPGEA